ncbi:hypothetical protein D3C79_701240 [compost metagenome]
MARPSNACRAPCLAGPRVAMEMADDTRHPAKNKKVASRVSSNTHAENTSGPIIEAASSITWIPLFTEASWAFSTRSGKYARNAGT